MENNQSFTELVDETKGNITELDQLILEIRQDAKKFQEEIKNIPNYYDEILEVIAEIRERNEAYRKETVSLFKEARGEAV
ncbi:hypothetical protein [Priestia filamentosa]|uniref:hypothetical protein n=1 Tax=Priestia filamentosa TaxID=1402861 RepID=UPI000A084A5D|nr:hypothetical protein [Priestia filamentosa]OXS67239.1 hypothetical protein B1B01_17255 [Priestia filamentosa]SMF53569.1 hypothetical protein SAMN06296056_104243 [Priestia filamentosa]